MKKILISTLILSVFLLSGCINFNNCIAGSNNIISENRTIELPFDSIHINGAADVYFTQGEKTPLTIEGDDNLLKEVETSVSGSTLTIENKDCFFNHNPIKITVSMENVKKLSIAGSGKMESVNNINSEDVEVLIMGSGSVKLKGNADNLDVLFQGSGNVEAYDLTTKSTKIRIEGSGSAKVNAEEELDVNIMGSGKVFYKGVPKMTQSISGSGKIESVE